MLLTITRQTQTRSTSSLVLTIFVIVILQLHQVCISEAYKDGLYSTDTDDVLPLNNATLMDRVIKNDEKLVWLVEFYNSWCGHCISFAPTYKQLASSLKGWNDLVRIAALDCSQSINLAACRKFEIDKYPTMKLFSPRSKENFKQGQTMRPLASQEMDVMKRKIIDFMTEFAPPDWPRLKPLEKMEDIWTEKTDQHKYVTLIFEGPGSQVGRKVILDMRNTPNVLIRTMLSDDVAKFGLTQFPSLYEITADSTFRQLGIGKKMAAQDHQLFVKMLEVLSRGDGDKLNFSRVSNKGSPSKAKQDEKSKDKQGHKVVVLSPSTNNSLRVSMQDLESALHYGFRQEIAICKSIGGPKFIALQKFVKALLKYFPGREPIMKFLQAVSRMLSEVTTSNLSGEEWITRIDNLQNSESFLPDVIEWDCCKGSMPRYRGYPCAMWTLFHVLTVNAYTQHSGSGRAANPLEAPLAIRGYMEHFFGCDECSKHFLGMASAMERDIADTKGAVLWLWSAHNKVNLRLTGDESEDKSYPKIQFPPPSLCSKCHLEKEKSISAPAWDTDAILKFLVSFYSEKSIYISPELSKRKYYSLSKDEVDSSSSNNNDNDNLNQQAARFESELGRNEEELDWWEKKQQEQDLKKVRWLRNRKKEKVDNMKMIEDGGGVERLVNRRETGDNRREKGDLKELKMRSSSSGIFSDLDLSMCVVFYVISTAIILGLYHHFIVRRNIAPCPTKCLR